MKDGKFKIAKNTQNWWGFTLQRGHAFGMYKGVCHVSAAEPDVYKPYNIVVYRQKKDKLNVDYYRWSRVSIPANSELGRLILHTLENSPYGGVQFRPEKYNGRVWIPVFPTFQTRRPETTPRMPKPIKSQTWVDRICQEVTIAIT